MFLKCTVTFSLNLPIPYYTDVFLLFTIETVFQNQTKPFFFHCDERLASVLKNFFSFLELSTLKKNNTHIIFWHFTNNIYNNFFILMFD